ncbi:MULTISPECIES: energy transducer TonB [unclassified Pseudomonas]|uniref:energy transducer TonB n=1 Tax=unclassified Pseudomonas TaxID=196821 RepID=UPI0021C5A6A7|nr:MULTISPECIES: energy transducer TonB [unclassified Pseudomonas]MCU1724560.1 energy transducer TonB [Pseudomonas sp. 5P_5.1_Bac1]MCU1735651.1 energy transducer TonB [Pseudomonas sp. 20P_3.2_Bac4]MCU1747218.1 energy transducer TonB [Pseudomonas sp. 20P_3.2_Bac5]
MIETRYKLGRYGGSLLLVLAVHAIAIVLALNWSAPQAIELPPAAMMIEMAPMPEPAPPPPPKVVTPPQPPAPVEEPPLPKLVEAPKPKIAIPKPAKPKAKPQPPKPEQKPDPQEKPVEQDVVDTPPSNAPAQKSAAPAPSIASNSNALPTWQSDLLRHLGKFKRYPEDARRRGLQGINRLRFVVDGEGRILSYSLAGGSGSAALDRATLEMIRKAQPVPAPPKELLNNGSIEVVAPFVYSLDKR